MSGNTVPAVPLNVRTADGSANKRFDTDYYVEGYASTFNDPYVLFTDWDGNEYREIIDPGALDGADMSDVIMQYDHEGKVLARMSNTRSLSSLTSTGYSSRQTLAALRPRATFTKRLLTALSRACRGLSAWALTNTTGTRTPRPLRASKRFSTCRR